MLQALVLLKSAEEEKERIGEAIERISALEMQGEKVCCAPLRLLEVFAEKGSDARGEEGEQRVRAETFLFSLIQHYTRHGTGAHWH